MNIHPGDVGIFDQTYSCLTRVVHEVLTLYTHPLTVGYSSVEFVTLYHLPSGIIRAHAIKFLQEKMVVSGE